DPVNLERPLAAGGRFGGHIVQGHVDATTTVTSVVELDDGSRRMGFAWPPGLDHYIVEKGSIALDGVSLTVAGLVETHAPGGFEVAVIPHTLAHTTLGQRTVDSTVNVEIDVLAKHVERLLAAGHTQETS
ncbi:MAG: riboflavin synthase, partial [Acidimicrobiia bacterium]|nr:riboflavin synthase [Acidimicrobiia bacterium]